MVKEIGVIRRSPVKEPKKFSFNLSEEELQEIKMRALKKNVSASIWIRKAIQAQIARENKFE